MIVPIHFRGFLRTGICLLLLVGVSAAQESVLVEVTASDTDIGGAPVAVELPKRLTDAPGHYLQRLDTGQEVIAQRSGESLVWILSGRLAKGTTRRYRVISRRTLSRTEDHVRCRESGNALQVSIQGRPVLTYHTATVIPPQGIDPVFSRSGFIHPLQTPAGKVVTADFPADHAHQHGIFFAWKQAEFEGRPVDFWNQADRSGNVEHVSTVQVESGPVFAEFRVNLRHLDLTAPDGSRPVLNEEWQVRIYHHPRVNVFDLHSNQECATASPLKLLQYHYGGMGYRGPTEWLTSEADCQITTSEGLDRKDGNHSRPDWVDVTGQLAGKICGLRAICHPENFRAPQPVRLHPNKPYFVFAPEVLGDFEIAPEEAYVSRYRYITFDGRPSAAVDALSRAYVAPPQVRIVE